MANTTKMTKKDYFNAILAIEAVASNEELTAFINHEIELLDKKNASRSDKPSAKQAENISIKEKIVAFLTNNAEGVTTKQIMDATGYSSQKITALITQLIKENKVERNVVKKVPYFTAVNQ